MLSIALKIEYVIRDIRINSKLSSKDLQGLSDLILWIVCLILCHDANVSHFFMFIILCSIIYSIIAR